MPWSRRFDRPIELPGGKIIATLGDARAYLLSRPKAEQKTQAFATALEAVVMAGEGRGPLLHANIGIGRLVHGPKPQAAPRPPRKAARAYRIVR